MSAQCPCGAREPSPLHLAECALRTEHLTMLAERAATLDVAVKASVLADLYSHLRGMYGDGGMAFRGVLLVLELGWRPTVGFGSIVPPVAPVEVTA